MPEIRHETPGHSLSYKVHPCKKQRDFIKITGFYKSFCKDEPCFRVAKSLQDINKVRRGAPKEEHTRHSITRRISSFH